MLIHCYNKNVTLPITVRYKGKEYAITENGTEVPDEFGEDLIRNHRGLYREGENSSRSTPLQPALKPIVETFADVVETTIIPQKKKRGRPFSISHPTEEA